MEDDQTKLYEKLFKKLNGTVSIVKKTNGIQFTIFMPYSDKPKVTQKKADIVDYSPVDFSYAQGLRTVIQGANPTIKIQYSDHKWSKEMAKLRKRYDDDFIAKVINHIYNNPNDTFWKTRILSASGLNKKFETVAAQMSEKKKGWMA